MSSKSKRDLTEDEKAQLVELGYNEDQIDRMPLAAAQAILADAAEEAEQEQPSSAPLRTQITAEAKKRLYKLGYQDIHIARMSLTERTAILTNSTPRPGSEAAIKANSKLMEQAGLPSPGTERFSDEAIEARNAKRPESSGVRVITDEFTQACVRGEDPIDHMLIEWQEANPGKRFRLINPDLPMAPGPQFQPVYDKDGKAVTQSGLTLGWMPEATYDREYRQPNLKRAKLMMGQIRETRATDEREEDLSLKPEDAAMVPLEKESITMRNSASNRAA